MELDQTILDMTTWRVITPTEAGLHICISPEKSPCRVARVLRLNLLAGQSYTLESGRYEMNAALIRGNARVHSAYFTEQMDKLDSFYLPGGCKVEITAEADMIMYIGAAVCEGYGKPFFRKMQPELPLGSIHQIHGKGVAEREVFFTLNPEMASSRLLCGLTWGHPGAWTSWPPHQHENDLEEVYCYFDIDAPDFGIHISYLKSGETSEAQAHIVQSGTMVLAPAGYHPTVACPHSRNAYFWVLAAHSHESRRYDLAKNDPCFE